MVLIVEITNRLIQKTVSSWSLPQIKRWSVALLEPDPISSQHSGKHRVYSFDESAKIYLGGILVRRMNRDLKDTTKIIADLWTWLENNRYLPSHIVVLKRNQHTKKYKAALKNTSKEWPELSFVIEKTEESFVYKVKKLFSSEEINESEYIKHIGLDYIGEYDVFKPEDRIGTVYYTKVINNFAYRLCITLNSS